MFLPRIIQRSFHTATVSYVRRKANPGIGIQTQVFQREGVLEPSEVDHDFDELESDFMDVHKTHKEHEREMQTQREQMRRWIVKNKYFKEKYPSFLTYAEKEQIKLLNSRDPEEWTVERLAESFPASTEIVRRIIRSKWVPKSAKRIQAHDEAVMENWEKLQKGEFPEINTSLKEHLKKFALRRKEDLKNLPSDWNPRPALPRPKRTDFLSLITSCKGYEDKEPQQKMLADPKTTAKGMVRVPSADEDETYLSGKIKDKRKMRLEDLKALKLRDTTQLLAPSVPENPSGTGVVKTQNPFSMVKYTTDEIVVSSDDIRKFEMAKIKDKIYIPHKLRKKGATYKVEDCYYDDDGEFLYRVPGMTGKSV